MDNESVVNIHDAVLVHDDATTNAPPPHTSASLTSSFATAVSVDDTSASSSNLPMWQQEKQGSKCCGCCCDYRNAVMILAVNRLGFLAFFVILYLVDYPEWTVDLFMMIVYMSMSICSLVGALKFSICLIAIDLLWCVVGFIIAAHLSIRDHGDFLGINWILILILACITISVMYAQIGFIVDVRRGIMSRASP